MADALNDDSGMPAEVNEDLTRIRADLVGAAGSADPFAAAVRASRVPVVITDPTLADNPIVFANDAFCHLTGYGREEVIGRNCRFLQGPETDPAAVARLRAAVRAGEAVELDIQNRRKDGGAFWNRLMVAPVRDAAGRPVFFVASQIEVTAERARLAGLESHNTALLEELAGRLRAQQDSEARLARLLALTPAGIVELDGLGVVGFANAAAESLLGVAAGGLAGRRWEEPRWGMAGPDGTAIAPERLPGARALRGEVVSDAALALTAADGRRLVVLVDCVPVRAEAGRGVHPAADPDWRAPGPVTGALLAFQDVTARHDAAEALAASEARFRLLANAVPQIIWLANADGTIAFVNRQWTAYTGTPSEAATNPNDSWLDFVHPDDHEATLRAWADARRTGAIFEVEHRIRSAAGQWRWFLVLAVPNFSALSGQVEHWYGTSTDIHDRREAEARLRELVDTLDLATIMVRDMDGTVRFWSRGCERMYGWPASEAVGQNAHGLLHTHFPTPREEIEAALLRDGEWRGDLHHVRRDGTRLITAAHKVLRRDHAGGPPMVMENLADVTALRRTQEELQRLNETLEARIEARTAELVAAEEQLRQAQKMEAVGQLTGGIAHDFNNMLQAIAGSLDMMQRRAKQGRVEEADRFAESARKTVERAASLTHRLLAFARRQALQPRTLDPDDLVAGMAELIQRTVGPSVQLELRTRNGCWAVMCDPNQLENVLLNLAINARDAMPDGGRLVISTANRRLTESDVSGQHEARAGNYVEIAVADTGMGMPAEIMERAFEPFFTTKPIGQGTGLGLSQVYGFVRQSGGLVKLDSAPGEGTTVRLFLPRCDSLAPLDEASAGQADGAARVAGDGETVLLVEDEVALRSLAAEILRDHGYTVLEAGDGRSALSVLDAWGGAPLSALVTDVGLPGGLNGRQLAEAARQAYPDLPVLFITGYAGTVLDGQLEPGMTVIGKPFALDALASHVRALLEARPTG